MGTYIVILNLSEKEDKILKKIKKIKRVKTDSELFYLCFREMAKKHSLLSEIELTFKFTPKSIKFNLDSGPTPEHPINESIIEILKPGNAREVILKPGNASEVKSKIRAGVVKNMGKSRRGSFSSFGSGKI